MRVVCVTRSLTVAARLTRNSIGCGIAALSTYGLKVTNMLSGGEAKQFEELLHFALQAVVLGIDGSLMFRNC